MSPRDDDPREMDGTREGTRRPGGPVPSGDAVLTGFLTELRELGRAPAPEPSPELAALLAGVTPLRTDGPGTGGLRADGSRAAWRRAGLRRGRVVVGAAAAVLLGGTGAAAAAGRLPEPAQRVVSDVVDRITPFRIPAGTPPAPAVPSPTGVAPAPSRPEDSTEPAEGHGSGTAGTGEDGPGARPGGGAAGNPGEDGAPSPGGDSGGDEGRSGDAGSGTGSGEQAGGSSAPGPGESGQRSGGAAGPGTRSGGSDGSGSGGSGEHEGGVTARPSGGPSGGDD